MNPQSPVTSVVKRGMLDGKKVADALAAITNTCSAGAQCAEVQADPIAKAALADLSANAGVVSTALTNKLQLQQQLEIADKNLVKALKTARRSLSTYETSVNGVSAGDASIISKAGLDSRPEAKADSLPVEKVPKVTSSLGKTTAQAVIRWPPTPGADHFEVQVNFTPQSPTATWTSLGTCSRRVKTVTAPSAGAQFTVRIGAVASDGTRADWSDAILATAR